MRGSFRFVPPEPRSDSLARPRLLRSLSGRWQHRITCVVGGPGLGKTTLLAQAIAENRLAPRGEDVWIGVEPPDADADRIARVVATALTRPDDGGGGDGQRGRETIVDPRVIADAVWQRAPTEACLVLDDVHLLQPGSAGAGWLADLVRALPANGHVVLASRSEPPVPLSRFGARGDVLRLDENDLRFSDEELSGFAQRRGIDPERFVDTGGWPAMAELAATVARPSAGTYLWEEVLEPLGTLRRHVLAVLCELGGADDALVSAAVGTTVDLSQILDGVPLVARGTDGWHVPHGLWRSAPGIALDPAERGQVCRRAIEHLSGRGRFDEAFTVVQDAELWDAAPAVLRSACLAVDRLLLSQVARWLRASNATVRDSLGGQLATSQHATFTSAGPNVTEQWREVAGRARAEDDLDVELLALAQLGQILWWQQDVEAGAQLALRVFELEPSGHPVARVMAKIARGLMADLEGDDAAIVAEFGTIESTALDTVWDISAGWLSGVAHLDLGNHTAAQEIVDRLSRSALPANHRYVLDALRLRTWWRLGRVDEVLADFPTVVAGGARTTSRYHQQSLELFASMCFSHAGDVTTAHRYLADARGTAPLPADGRVPVTVAVAAASLQLADGGEDAARATLRTAVAAHQIDQGQDRRAWRQQLASIYVLLPETRAHWDDLALRGFLQTARDLAAAVVALREGRGQERLRRLDLSDLGTVRAALHHRFATELAVGLAAVGRSEGRVLLEMLGTSGRSAARDLVANNELQAKQARSLLATVPAPPTRSTYLAVLGTLALRRDGPAGEDVVDPDLRRRRLQELVAFLIRHRRTTRVAITATLWPDLDERSAANNLGVTLNHLLRILEPWRDPGDPAYLLRLDGQTIQLVTGEHLRIDLDDFDALLIAAERAESDGAPSTALEQYLAALGLYRDELYSDLAEASWFSLEREHYKIRFVAAAVRAGQLLLSRGDVEQAANVAHRALAVDPWSEEGYAVLVGGALARRDRSGAHRLLTHCFDALAELGVEPSPATRQLERRAHGIEP